MSNIVKGDFKLSSFKSRFVPVRPNLFTAQLSVGTNLVTPLGWNSVSNTFGFRVESAEFPGKSFSVGEFVGGGGPMVKVPQDVTYSDITLTIICSEDFAERKFFDKWMNFIYKDFDFADTQDKSSRGLFEYYNEYAKSNTLTVYQWKQNGDLIHTTKMYEVFPTALSPMTANWDERDTYQRFTVTLAYNRMQIS